MGDIGCFSFYPGKNLGAYGDGGAAVTSHPDYVDTMRLLRSRGEKTRYGHSIRGFNYRMEGIQGAMLGAKLRYLDQWTEARRTRAAAYTQLLAGTTFLRQTLSVRLADIWGLAQILFALVLTGGWRLPRWPGALRVFGMVVMGLTAAAIVPMGNVHEEISKTGLTAGPARVSERFQEVSRDLSAGHEERDPRPLEAYLEACTAPSDRLLAFAFLPELFYETDRGFAAGYATFVEGHHAGLFEQRLGIDRWRGQSVPYAVAYEGQVDELAASFPLIGEELRRRYAPVYRRETGGRRGALVVFAERDRRVEGAYAPLDVPCFAARSRSASS